MHMARKMCCQEKCALKLQLRREREREKATERQRERERGRVRGERARTELKCVPLHKYRAKVPGGKRERQTAKGERRQGQRGSGAAVEVSVLWQQLPHTSQHTHPTSQRGGFRRLDLNAFLPLAKANSSRGERRSKGGCKGGLSALSAL